jgi:predicted KAP-like P-loop ATPase
MHDSKAGKYHMTQTALHTDHAIEKIAEDSLGRKEFAQNVAKAIAHYQTGQDSFVIGLYGEWGYGKTSVINMVCESLGEQESAPIIIRFCPWYFSGQDQLLEQFFQQLASEIRGSFEKAKDTTQDMADKAGKVADKIIKFSNIVRPIKHVAPLLGIPSVIIDGGIDAIQKAASQVKGITDAVGELNIQHSFDPHRLKKEIGAALSELDRKVLIIIDDIDRLTKEEIRQIFQLVKALADFKNTIYLLSFDPKEVCAALKDVQTDHPEQYLEKIVQIPFELPIVSPAQIFGHLTQSLDNIIVPEDWNESLQKYWSQLCYYGFKSYFTNLREVNRFLNVCQFNYASLKGEVNLVDLFVMTAINIQHPALYRFIKGNKHVFCGNGSSPSSETQKKNDTLAKEQYLAFRVQNPEIKNLEPLLTELFPYFHKILSESHWGSGLDQRELKKGQRIASEQHFDCFFQLSIPDGQLSDQTVFALIALQDQPDLLLEKIQQYSYENQKELIDRFYTHKERFESQHYVAVAEALMPLAENMDESDYSGFFSLPLSDVVRFFIRDLFSFDEATDSERLKRYAALFTSPRSDTYMMSSILWDVIEIAGLMDGHRNFQRELLETCQFKPEYEALGEMLVARIKQLVQENVLQHHHQMTAILYAWWRVHPEAAKEYVNKLIETREGLVEFITASLGYKYSSRDGKVPRIHWKNIADFVTDTTRLVERVKQIRNQPDFGELPEKSRLAIDALLKSAENPDQDI